MPAPMPLRSTDSAGDATYFLLQGASSGTQAIDEELASSVRLAMADNGWIEVAPRDARTVIITNVATVAKRTPASFYTGWGGWHWQSASAPTPRPQVYAPGTLIVDAFDTDTHTLFSRGAAPNLISRVKGHTTLSEHQLDQLARALPAPTNSLGTSEKPTPGTEIRFVERPVAVLRIDGTPRYEPVKGTDLQRVVNTRSFVVRDVAGMHFLKLPTGWMEADTLRGPWTMAGTVPDEATLALQLTNETTRIADPEILRPSRSNGVEPTGGDELSVLVASERTTVVVTTGELALAPIERTALLQASNSSAPLYKEPTDEELYVRLPQGWYRAWSLDGPWESVAQSDLPADFSALPSEARR
jgi:hypothetical protein